MSTKTTDVTGLRTALEAYLDENEGWRRGDARILTAREWKARGERVGENADLHLVVDGSPLYASLNYGEPSWFAETELRELAARFGYYYELGFAWSVHFYPL